MADDFDLAVIGGGPGGYVAAIRAAQLGLKAAVIERDTLGGICLNWGCIPTKALLHIAELYHALHHLESFGLAADNPRFDAKKVVAHSRKASEQLTRGVKFLMEKNKIEVVEGEGRIESAGNISVTAKDGASRTIGATNILIATGARAKDIPGLIEADGEVIWNYRHALMPPQIPKTLLVVGAGAIGVEFASFYAAMGADVSLVEAQPHILPNEDSEIAKLAARAFKKRGIIILEGARLEKLDISKQGATARITRENAPAKDITAERVICAVGITGNVENIGLEKAGVPVQRGHIVTGEAGTTGVKGIYAIGDVAGPPWLAHKAMHEGVACVEHIAGVRKHSSRFPVVPSCTYSHPQIASVGLTEEAAQRSGHAVRVGRFNFRANGKAIALGETEGMVKTIFDSGTGELLGAHMLGPDVTELIQGYVVAMGLESTEVELMQTIFAHPTLSEAMHEAVLDAFGQALHA
jgi:dihydrolipoamide dehydrogenase